MSADCWSVPPPRFGPAQRRLARVLRSLDPMPVLERAESWSGQGDLLAETRRSLADLRRLGEDVVCRAATLTDGDGEALEAATTRDLDDVLIAAGAMRVAADGLAYVRRGGTDLLLDARSARRPGPPPPPDAETGVVDAYLRRLRVWSEGHDDREARAIAWLALLDSDLAAARSALEGLQVRDRTDVAPPDRALDLDSPIRPDNGPDRAFATEDEPGGPGAPGRGSPVSTDEPGDDLRLGERAERPGSRSASISTPAPIPGSTQARLAGHAVEPAAAEPTTTTSSAPWVPTPHPGPTSPGHADPPSGGAGGAVAGAAGTRRPGGRAGARGRASYASGPEPEDDTGGPAVLR